MRRQILTINTVKQKLDELVGKNILMQVCRGRKQVKKYKGIVERTFPSVFVIRLTDGSTVTPTLSYSYSDIVCGDVVITQA